jgi:23S rRNA pseudouridine2605 synthase
MEKNFKDKKSRPSRLGKRNEASNSFDNKKSRNSFAQNSNADKENKTNRKPKFDKSDNNNKSFGNRKKSGIRTTQSKDYDIEQLTGVKAQKSNFKSRNYNRSTQNKPEEDHFYGKPFEKKTNKSKESRERSFDKPFRKEDKPFRKRTNTSSSQGEGNSYEQKGRNFNKFSNNTEGKSFRKRTNNSSSQGEGNSYEQKGRNFNKFSNNTEGKPFRKRTNNSSSQGEGNSYEQKGRNFNKFSNNTEGKPFRKRTNNSSSQGEGNSYEQKGRNFNKFSNNTEGKPFRKRTNNSSSQGEGNSYEQKGRSFNKFSNNTEEKPFRKRTNNFDNDEKSFPKKDNFQKENKPFRKRETTSKDNQTSNTKSRNNDFNKKLEFEDFSYEENAKSKSRFDRTGKLNEQKSKFPNKQKTTENKTSEEKRIKTPDYDLKKFKEIETSIAEKERVKRKRITKKKDEINYEEIKTDHKEVRLNRFIANAGVCSRREADELIAKGRIKINGEVMTELGYKVKPTDSVYFDDEPLKKERIVYVLLNKPKDHITTTDDPEGRKTVMNLVKQACNERIYPVGRLDRNTTGLLLMTNDGKLAEKLAHPSNNIKKAYQILLERPILEEDFNKIVQGIELEDGLIKADKLSVISDDGSALEMQIHSGRNRIVRRIFEHLGYEVLRLDRVGYAGLTKKGLTRGEWRYLTEQEVIRLKYFVK